jgi:CRISPR/Cas system CSM-associated protein Csm3 (group 7 of RAMP superfamily)
MSERAVGKGWQIARVTIEAVSPLSCGAGQGLDADNAIVRDANGLPMIPGTTLQGLLRQAYAGSDKPELFGGTQGATTITAARLIFSNALVHNSHNVAVQFPTDPECDELLKHLMADAPLKRDHVRLDHRHTAAKGGKFERAAVPAGTRFSFELMLFGTSEEGTKLSDVLAGLKGETFRIGSSGYRGYGKVDVSRAKGAFYAVADARALRELRKTPLSTAEKMWGDLTLCNSGDPLTISLKLTPINPWRTGQDGLQVAADERKKSAPVRESKIDWSGDSDKGVWIKPTADNKSGYLLPGSSLRGPLAHRALFHWNVQNGHSICANDLAKAADNLEVFLKHKAHLISLFGDARDDGTGGQVSALIFDDVEISKPTVGDVDHIKIDRFTGGVFQGALYSEELLKPEELTCTIRVRSNRAAAICDKSRTAFLAGLRDLVEGRLALGAKSYGFCNGPGPDFTGTDAEAWQVAYAATDRGNVG